MFLFVKILKEHLKRNQFAADCAVLEISFGQKILNISQHRCFADGRALQKLFKIRDIGAISYDGFVGQVLCGFCGQKEFFTEVCYVGHNHTSFFENI